MHGRPDGGSILRTSHCRLLQLWTVLHVAVVLSMIGQSRLLHRFMLVHARPCQSSACSQPPSGSGLTAGTLRPAFRIAGLSQQRGGTVMPDLLPGVPLEGACGAVCRGAVCNIHRLPHGSLTDRHQELRIPTPCPCLRCSAVYRIRKSSIATLPK